MKAISISLENLSNGHVRVTGRSQGITVSQKEGPSSQQHANLRAVMAESCAAHRAGDTYDLTHISLNPAALAIYQQPPTTMKATETEPKLPTPGVPFVGTAPHGWMVQSSSSGLRWHALRPILEPGDPSRLHLDYFQRPAREGERV